MEHWGGLQAVFNGTKQNVVAFSDYECLLWGMKETGPLGGDGGRRMSCWRGDTTTEGIKARREQSAGCGSKGFGCWEPLGPLTEKAG